MRKRHAAKISAADVHSVGYVFRKFHQWKKCKSAADRAENGPTRVIFRCGWKSQPVAVKADGTPHVSDPQCHNADARVHSFSRITNCRSLAAAAPTAIRITISV